MPPPPPQKNGKYHLFLCIWNLQFIMPEQEKKRGWGQGLTFPVATASLSVLLSSTFCLISLSSLRSPPSLASALLMNPRQETEPARGSKAIFPPMLCHFLLAVAAAAAAIHWNFWAEKNQWDTSERISRSAIAEQKQTRALNTRAL